MLNICVVCFVFLFFSMARKTPGLLKCGQAFCAPRPSDPGGSGFGFGRLGRSGRRASAATTSSAGGSGSQASMSSSAVRTARPWRGGCRFLGPPQHDATGFLVVSFKIHQNGVAPKKTHPNLFLGFILVFLEETNLIRVPLGSLGRVGGVSQ